jgi:general stress protein 26
MDAPGQSSASTDIQELWGLIDSEHVAVLVTVDKDGALDARPMGCLGHGDRTLWFMTFRHADKLSEIETNQHVLVSYARSAKYQFAAVSGKARLVEDQSKIRELWREGFRTWFPDGPASPNIALIAVDMETAKYWTKPASIFTYAYFYVRARVTGKAPSPQQIAEHKVIRFSNAGER